jgi:putative pyruvate formate lyase activating enzyme
MSFFEPAYLRLLKDGALDERAAIAGQRLSCCNLCAWECKVDRKSGKLGVCKTGLLARVSSYGPHLGEERPLRGWRGSGTVFLARCNLHCQFCQNHEISQTDAGRAVEPQELAAILLELQEDGCHNINFVSPSHVVPQILAAVSIAARTGLRIPLVYNTGGYDSVSTLKLLDGVIDIYMPDMKYASPQAGLRYSKVRNYPEVNRAAVREMYHQVGDLQLDERGLARRGLLVRHLVLPYGLAGIAEVAHFLAAEISTNTYLNVMDQYYPAFNAHLFSKLNRPVTRAEYQDAVNMALDAGLQRLDSR